MKVVLATVSLVLVLVAGLCLLSAPRASAQGQDVDLVTELLRLREEGQPVAGGEDAWPLYVSVFRDTMGMSAFRDSDASELASLYAQVRTEEFGRLLAREWEDPRLDAGRAVLARLGPVLDALRRAAAAPNCRAPIFPDEGFKLAIGDTPLDVEDAKPGDASSGYSEPLRLLGPLFLRLLAADARASARAGDVDRAAGDYVALLNMSDHLGASPLQASQLARLQMASAALLELRITLTETPWPVDAIDALLAELDPSKRRYLYGDYLSRSATANAMLIARSHAALLEEASLLERLVGRPPTAERVRRASEAYFRAAVETADNPPSQRTNVLDQDDADIDARLHARDSVEGLLRRRDRLLAELAATRVVLRLARHRSERGEWPASLADAMPAEATLEPISGEPFVYLRTPVGPAPFTLRAPADGVFRADDRDLVKPREPLSVENGRGRASPRR